MSGRKDDPDLAPDASLATEITPEIEDERLAHLGGEKDDIDDFDATDLDDGSVLPEGYDPLNPPPAPEPKDEDDNDDDPDPDEDPDDDAGDPDDGTDADKDDDGESDGDDGEEEEGEGEETDVADDPPKTQGIPKHRFDEVNERRKAAEEERDRLKAQLEAGKPPEKEEAQFDFRSAEKEYMDLLLDGDTENALAKREEIDAAKEAKWRAETTNATKTELNETETQNELLALSQEAEEMFDVFNPESSEYDQVKLDKVLTFMSGYEARGMSKPDAFVAGLADVVEMFDMMPPDDAGDPDPDPKPKPTGKRKTDSRKQGMAEKAHQAVGKSGSASADTGAVVPNIEDMTDEELDALPEKTLARMRGDIL